MQKQLYHQYLGFIKSVNLFTQNIIGIQHFTFNQTPLTFEEFSSFKLESKMPLGKRVERFFEFHIEQGDEYQILQKNVQINHEKRTIGEFDFFLEELATQKVIHVELVYKFYIYKEHDLEVKRYHGPNNHDNLEEKLQKLEQRQFPLLYNPYAKEALEAFEVEKIEQNLCFFGNIFLHHAHQAKFEAINPKAVVGSYLSFKEFLDNDSFRNKRYAIPKKEDWLMELDYCEAWLDYKQSVGEMREYFKRNISLLLWVQDENRFFKMFILK